ncbi:MAG: ankyrin repeat domain-containing protein [Endozoicomonadaceae bacterium]|nr:ankyrin repeat domain-containing protein [Endozoicomonadaceae bacterium]
MKMMIFFSGASVLLYPSKGEKKNLSCKFLRNNELIKCFNLAHWWLAKDKFKYEDIASESLIKECQDIHSTPEINKEFYFNGYPSEGIYFETEDFPKAICNLAVTLTKGQEKRYLLCSVKHSMGLCIKKSIDNNIVLYYYDPNDTLRHLKIIAKTAYGLKSLRCNDFWIPVNQKLYFPGEAKVGCLISLDTTTFQKDCDVVCMINQSTELIFLLSCYGHYGHYGHSATLFNSECFDENAQVSLFIRELQTGIPALNIACQNGHSESVKALIKVMSSIDLSPYEKKEFLTAKDHKSIPALNIACQNGHSESVKALIKAMSFIDLSPYEKKEFLTAKDHRSITALHIACQNERSESVKALIKAMSFIDLSPYEKKEFLTAKDHIGVPALYTACRNGHIESVKALLKAISSIDLSLNEKKEFLAGKNATGIPALYIACQHGRHEVVKILIETMCSSDLKFNMTEQEELITGEKTNIVPALFMALIQKHPETVKVYLNAVLISPLDLTAKERLLTADSAYGLPALQMVINDRKMDVVKVFVEIVKNSTVLLAGEKDRLLYPYNRHEQDDKSCIIL